MWNENSEKKDEKTTSAYIVLLGLCVSSTIHVRNDMKKAFSWLERHVRKEEGNFYEFLNKYIFQVHGSGVWPTPCYEMAKKYLSLNWSEFESDFWKARSFSFVGDYAEEELLEGVGDDNGSFFKKANSMFI